MKITTLPLLALQFGSSPNVLSVPSIEAASAVYASVRDLYGFGASDAFNAYVVDVSTGERVARISYNGRAWDLQDQEIPQKGRKTVAQHNSEGWKDCLCVS